MPNCPTFDSGYSSKTENTTREVIFGHCLRRDRRYEVVAGGMSFPAIGSPSTEQLGTASDADEERSHSYRKADYSIGCKNCNAGKGDVEDTL